MDLDAAIAECEEVIRDLRAELDSEQRRLKILRAAKAELNGNTNDAIPNQKAFVRQCLSDTSDGLSVFELMELLRVHWPAISYFYAHRLIVMAGAVKCGTTMRNNRNCFRYRIMDTDG